MGRQRAAANSVFIKLWLDVKHSTINRYFAFVVVLKLTFFNYPTIGNTCSLVPIFVDILKYVTRNQKPYSNNLKLKKLHQSSIIFFASVIWSCNTFKPTQNSFTRYNGSSFIDFLQDVNFLDFKEENFKTSELEITFCLANPYTCTTKFFFISKNNKHQWTANSYKYCRCLDTVNIEKVKLKLDNKWDSIYALITNERLFKIQRLDYYIKRIPRQKANFLDTGGDINYSFLVKSKKTFNNIEMNRVESYREHYVNSEVDISGFEKLIRLKYLFSLVFDFDTDFKFIK